jgi:GTP-binding protein HflX
MKTLKNINIDIEKAMLVAVQLPGVSDAENGSSLAELGRLVETLGFEVIGALTQKRKSTRSAYVLGDGKVAEVSKMTGGPGIKAPNFSGKAKKDEIPVDEDEDAEASDSDSESDALALEGLVQPKNEADGEPPTVVVFDCDLTPSQLRNLEQAFACDVLDRTGVIIEIFSRHARTRTARLQVEIARLQYMAPRIRETGGGGDRQGGGVGAKGAGETAVELDRRKIRDRIKELKSEFAAIDNEHETRRARRSDLRTIALVGYTNAGKSSTMRALTGSEVYVADRLFATLDTTVRPLHPEARPPILVSDTVGFIKKLPHDLVASFKSTLEEAASASLLLFLVDASDPAFREQLQVTQETLKEVLKEEVDSLLILNKSDRLTSEQKVELLREYPEAVLVSTRSPEDISRLRETIVSRFESEMVDQEMFIPYDRKGVIGSLRSHARVVGETYEQDGVKLTLRATPDELSRLKNKHGL